MFQGEAVFALVVAAGQSTRMGGADKIFSPLAGVPVLARSVESFLTSALEGIIVVLRAERLVAGRQLAAERKWPAQVRFCSGGVRRQDSVRLGLEEISPAGWVLIHDGARPLFTPELVGRGLEAARATGAAVPGLPLADTVKLASPEGIVERTLPRERLWAVQTPQVFRLDLIRAAHRHFAQSEQTFTDDAAMLEALGERVAIFLGEANNLKVTTPDDLRQAAALWAEREEGNG